MASFVGMDPEAIRRVAESLRQSAEHLGVIQDTIQRLMNEGISGWEGADAVDFTYQWDGEHRASLQTAMTAMEKMANDVIEDIAEQEKASGIVPGGPGSVLPPGSVIPGTTTPTGGLTAEDLAEMDPDEAAAALEAMPPAQAAALLEAMDPEEAGALLTAMGSPANAALLAAMSPAARVAALGAMSNADALTALQNMSAGQMDETLAAMNPEQLAETIGASVTVDTVKAFVEGSGELGSWKVEGAADATYKVMADGSVVMTAHLEGGLGKSIDSAGMEGSVTGGLQGEYELKFSSVEEAEAFLEDLGNAVTDLSVDDITDPVGAVQDNISDAFEHADQQSVKFGGYIKGEVEGEVGEFVKGAGEARVDYTYDPGQGEHSLKFSAEAKLEGDLGDGLSANVGEKVEAEIKVNGDGVSEINLTRSVDGSYAAEALGDKVAVGGGGQLSINIKPTDPGFDQVAEAVKSGDIGRATQLAIENSTLTYREYVTEEFAHGEGDLKLKVPIVGTTIAGAEYEYGASGESATKVLVKPAGSNTTYDITEGMRQ